MEKQSANQANAACKADSCQGSDQPIFPPRGGNEESGVQQSAERKNAHRKGDDFAEIKKRVPASGYGRWAGDRFTPSFATALQRTGYSLTSSFTRATTRVMSSFCEWPLEKAEILFRMHRMICFGVQSRQVRSRFSSRCCPQNSPWGFSDSVIPSWTVLGRCTEPNITCKSLSQPDFGSRTW
jgi:hypothetical protein